MLLHRVWIVSQQHGNMIHAHMLLQKFDGKGISKHVRLGLDAFALLALHAKRPRRRLTALHKLFWVALRTFWSGWTNSLVLVTPRTVVSWHRAVSFVLGRGLKSQTSSRTKVCQQRGSRPDLPYGCRESDLGSPAHSRRTAQVGFRSLRKECLAMGSARPERSRSREAMADVPQESSRRHCCDGLLYRLNAHVW